MSAIQRAKSTSFSQGIKHQLIPEYNLVNELHLSLAEAPLHLDPNHVKGHQDNGTIYDELSPQSTLNVDCNHLTGNLLDDYEGLFEPCPTPPFIPSSKVSLVIDYCIGTTYLLNKICMETNGKDIRKYITTPNEYSNETFNSLDWTSLGI